MKVACNASPLIWLSHIGRFALLHELFEVVLIPPEVWAETVERAMGYPNAETVRAACEAGWTVVVPLHEESSRPGKANVMLLPAERPQKEKRELIVFRDWLAVDC